VLGVLDIGTSTTACCIVTPAGRPGAGRPLTAEVLGVAQQPSRGLKAGTVIELDAAEQSVRAAVTEAERAAGAELRQVVLAVACGRVKSTTFAADATIGGRAVAAADVGRLGAAGRSYVERDGRTLLHMNCLGYRLDGAAGIADPCGLAGRHLSADWHAVSADDAPLRNLVQVAERAYLTVTGLVPAAYASGLAVTTAEERAAGVVALDFGAGTTQLALFADGHLIANELIPIGGHHISFDLARAFEISLAQAERLKVLYASMARAAADDHTPIPLAFMGGEGTRPEPVSRARLRDIVLTRMRGVLGQVGERLARAGVSLPSTQRVVITGGASQLAGLAEWVSEVLEKPVRTGQATATAVRGAVTPALSTALGLAHVAFDPTAGVRRSERSFPGGGYLRSVGRWLQASF
jgi:cell division protein FtsA